MVNSDSEHTVEYINSKLGKIPGVLERFSQYSCLPGGFMISRADEHGEILYANSQALEIIECHTEEQFLEVTGGSWRRLAPDFDISVVDSSLSGWRRDGASYVSRFHLMGNCPSPGHWMRDVELFCSFTRDRDLGDLVLFFIVFARDERDILTDFPTMSRFLSICNNARSVILRNGDTPAMVSFNLNGLKMFNEKYGISGGDALIVSFANILKKHFGIMQCSRFGEDHFYAYTGVRGLEEKISLIFEEMAQVNDGNTLSVRAGIYVQESENDQVSASRACDNARIACDYERRHHESCFVYYDKKIRNEILNRDYIIGHIDEALEKEYIHVYYQPQVISQSGKLCGYEALARWIDPEMGMVSPGVFIPVLDDYSLTYKLDLYIIEHVARDLTESISRGISVVPVSFNLSRTDFVKCDPFTEIISIAERYKLPRELFKVEITETTVMSDIDKMKGEINRFHEAGFDVLMDDFGSAYSSLSTLRDFEFDEIKIDMGFMRNFSPRSKAIIKPIVNMAKALGIHTLAEGVETQEQLDFLKSIGCEMIQGYYFGKPEPFEAAIDTAKRLNKNYELLLHQNSSMVFSKNTQKKSADKNLLALTDNREQGLILEKVVSIFSNVLSIDIVNNVCEEIVSSYEMHRLLDLGASNIGQKLKDAVSELVKPEHHIRLLKFLEFDTLSERLDDDTVISCDFQSAVDDSYFRVEIFVLEKNEEGTVSRILFTTRTVEPDRVTQEHFRTVTHALRHVYSGLVAFNLDDRTFVPYVMPVSMMERTGVTKQPYDMARNFFMETFVCNRHREMMFRFTDLDTLGERLAGKPLIYLRYQNLADEWCEMTYIPSRIADDGRITQVLAAVRNLEHEHDQQINRQVWDVKEEGSS